MISSPPTTRELIAILYHGSNNSYGVEKIQTMKLE
jgi:hypothetical protein